MKLSARKQKKLKKALGYFVTELSEENIGKPFTKSELVEDIDFMIKTMEEVHPNLYFYFTKEKTRPLLDKIKNSLHDEFDRIEFYTLIAELVANFHDGHTAVQFPNEEYFKYKNEGGLFFPFDIDCSSGKILIVRSHYEDKCLHQNKVITSINGLLAEELLNSMIVLRGLERREMNLKFVSLNFRRMLHLLYGNKSIYTVSLKNNDSLEEYEIPGVSFEVIDENKKQDPKVQEEPYSFMINQDEGYALLDFREFVDLDNFKKFAQRFFKEIESTGVTKLIVDLRKNGGGDSSLTDEFACYITDKPFRQFSRMDLKISKQIRKYYSLMMKLFAPFPMSLIPGKLLFRAPWKKDIGETISNHIKVKKHKPKQPFFTGRVIVLTSAYTFSSATGFSTAIQDNDLGIIVGNPTGGFPSTHGDCFRFSLPNTCLQCTVSHKFFVRPSGNENPEPLYPDYLIEESFPGSQTDKVLEFAINHED